MFISIIRNRGLRLIAVFQFICMLVIGIYAGGCSTSMPQNARTAPTVLETTADDGTVTRLETLSDGTTAISTMKPGLDRPTNHSTTATSLATKSRCQGTYARIDNDMKLLTRGFTVGK